MGSFAPKTIIWLAMGYAAVMGSSALAKLSRLGEAVLQRAVVEHRLLECGRVLAAERNLDDAAGYLGSLQPEAAADLASAADEIVEELRGAYAPCLLGDTTQKLGVRLELQSHPGQPESWPNWVARLTRD